MRETLADLIKKTGVNYEAECSLLSRMFNNSILTEFKTVINPSAQFESLIEDEGSVSLRCVIDYYYNNFDLTLRGSTRLLSDFDQYYKIEERLNQEYADLDDLLLLIEYYLTFINQMLRVLRIDVSIESMVCGIVNKHMNQLIARLHHRLVWKGAIALLVPENMIESEVASRFSADLSIKTFEYNHRSMKGKLAEKQAVLALLGTQLEPSKKELKKLNEDLSDNIFKLLNNINIRHNNTAEGGSYFKNRVAKLSANQLEELYDNLYDMMIAAFALLNVRTTIDEIAKLDFKV